MSAATLRALAPLARRQFGVFTTSQAATVGVQAWTLTKMVRRGDAVRLFHGVYALTVYPDRWELRWLAALLAVGDRAAISHRAAGHLHGLQHTRTRERPELELTVPRSVADPIVDGLRVHTQVGITPDDVVEVGVWRVTSVAWTLATLAHSLGFTRTERALGAAVANDRTTVDDLARATVRRRWCPGAPVMRAALRRLTPGTRMTRSEAERLFLRLCVGAGLPAPEVNLRVGDDAGRTRYLDAAWPAFRVCVEIDVHPDHSGSIGRSHDGRRQNDLVSRWTVLRFDEFDLVYDPTYVVDRLRATLRRAGAAV
ncbi:MAG: type IV toxin-antitoxin system AbiEi family antitoxin domain-containing protein [Actinobacteria bacterium]|nr:type IV toxin-antitoxin system AbiEi family antitoxin domain-containing protein [Actinomycetota bacterium]